MKNLTKAVLLSAILCIAFSATAQKNTRKNMNIKLNEPNYALDVTLMNALQNRQTQRAISTQELSWQQLSDVLWAANGINRADSKKRTAPSARNAQEIDIYVFTATGVFFYNPENHELVRRSDKDCRKDVCSQKMAADAPVTLLFVGNFDKMQGFDADTQAFYSATDAGFVSQNVYLYCAAANLATVVCGSINRENAAKILGLKNAKALLAQPLGYPAK